MEVDEWRNLAAVAGGADAVSHRPAKRLSSVTSGVFAEHFVLRHVRRFDVPRRQSAAIRCENYGKTSVNAVLIASITRASRPWPTLAARIAATLS